MAHKITAGQEVLVRQKQLSGDALMVRATVLSIQGDVARVKFAKKLHPVEVQVADVIAAPKVFGPQRSVPATSILQRAYPSSQNALGNLLYR